MSRNKLGLREENYEKILIGNNFVTDDVLIERNVTPYDFEAFWVTVPQYVNSPIFIYFIKFLWSFCYSNNFHLVLFVFATSNLLITSKSLNSRPFMDIELEIVSCSPNLK